MMTQVQSITVDASVENIGKITGFIDEILEGNDCSMRAQMQIDVALDEILSNVAYYAYPKGVTGQVTVDVSIEDRNAKITFKDSGSPYNPLEKDDPDTTLSVEDRDIGGLGIFMVKKSMNSMEYCYEDGQNILTIVKEI